MLFANMDVTDSDKIESPDIEKEIIKKFYSILDYIQITLSKTPRNVVKDIIKRETDAGKSLYDTKRYLKSIITDILTPTNELQQDSPEELKRKLQEGQLTKKEFDKKLAVSIQLDSVEEADKIIDARDRYNDIINNLIT
jgi:hypothetical protein